MSKRSNQLLADLKAREQTAAGRAGVTELLEAKTEIRAAKRRRLEATDVLLAKSASHHRVKGPKSAQELREALAKDGADPAALISAFERNVEAELIRKIQGDEPVDENDDTIDESRVDLYMALKQALSESAQTVPSHIKGVLQLAGVTDVPIPMDLTNLQVVLDPYMWIVFFDEIGIGEQDLADRFRSVSSGGNLGKAFLRDATEVLSVNDQVPDAKMLASLCRLFLQVASAFVRGDPTDPLEKFCVSQQHLLLAARELCKELYSEHAQAAGLDIKDLGLPLRLSKVPAWAKTATETALKARLMRRGDKADKPRVEPVKKRIDFDPAKHLMRGDIVHLKRADGSHGKALGRRK